MDRKVKWGILGYAWIARDRVIPGMKILKELLDQKAVGGCLRDVGCYPLNLIGWILDDYPIAISAEKTMFQGVDHALTANLRYKNGVLANISCGFDGCSAMVTEINGTKGSILIRDSFIDTTAPLLVIDGDGRTRQIPVESSSCYQAEVEEFSDAVLNNREPALKIKETIRNCRLIEEVLETARIM